MFFVMWMGIDLGGTHLSGSVYLSNDFNNRGIDITTAGLALSLFHIGKVAATTTMIPIVNIVGRKVLVIYSSVALFITFVVTALSVNVQDKTDYSMLIGALRFLQGLLASYSALSM